jgi:hypothetical protein
MWDSGDEIADFALERFFAANLNSAGGSDDDADATTEQTTTEEVAEEADVKVVWCEGGVFKCLGEYVQRASNINPVASRLLKVAYKRSITITLTSI